MNNSHICDDWSIGCYFTARLISPRAWFTYWSVNPLGSALLASFIMLIIPIMIGLVGGELTLTDVNTEESCQDKLTHTVEKANLKAAHGGKGRGKVELGNKREEYRIKKGWLMTEVNKLANSWCTKEIWSARAQWQVRSLASLFPYVHKSLCDNASHYIT